MDPKGRIVVVTGATSGLGQAAALDFSRAGARVFVVGRDAARAEETRARAEAAGNPVEVILGDVSTRAGARAVGAAVLERTEKVDVLLNNAGGSFATRSTTADGIESTFALNTLGAFVLEQVLHLALAEAKGRVVNVATGFLDWYPLDPADLVDPKKYASNPQYGRAKQASVMMTVEQAKRFAADGVSAVSVHPGIIMGTRFGGGQSSLVQALAGPVMRGIGIACSLEEAVRRFNVACWGDVPSGSYLVKGEVAPLPKQVNDATVRARVWDLVDGLARSG